MYENKRHGKLSAVGSILNYDAIEQ
jgi:hypothetical protein